MLNKFIEGNLGKFCWFTVPSGLFHGKIYNVSTDKEKDVLILENSFYIAGNIKLNMDKSAILRNTISSWGEGSPSVNTIFTKDD
jgi:hypothetical protein